MCEIAAKLTAADIPVFERALRAIDERNLAWLGFKIVLDPAVAVTNVDNEVTKKFGDKGSANGDSFIFFANDAKEIVCAHEYSGRDLMQMKDVTRGHMYDPQSCAWGVACNTHYVGMMGCKGKNEKVHDLVIGLGATEEGWACIKRPIGLKFGAKTTDELAVSIVAELIDVRYKENYSEAARVQHESHLD